MGPKLCVGLFASFCVFAMAKTTPGKSMSPPRASSKTGKTSSSTKGPNTATQVLWYYPNLIGYLRLGCMIGSFWYFLTDWKYTIQFYLAAFGGDVVDGFVARLFDQSSSYGGSLDMVTDRLSTAGFLFMLSHLYPRHTFYLNLLMCLDVGSHWFHVVSTLMQGDGGGHHKSKDTLANRIFLLRWYYGIYPFFGYCCVGAELFYVLLYVHYWAPSDLVFKLCFYCCLPACVVKNIVNVFQLCSACYAMAEMDASKRNADPKRQQHANNKYNNNNNNESVTGTAAATTPVCAARGRSVSKRK